MIKVPTENGEITIDMGDETKVPAEILESLAGKDVEISFDLGNVQCPVNGADIPTDADFTDLDLRVDLDTSGISVNVINAITGEVGTVQITLAHDGEFGFTMTLTAPLGKENAGYWANLYHYDESAEAMNFEAAARIDQDGSVTIPFSHASQYAIVIDDHSHAAEAALPFTDVNADDWFSDVVRYVYEQGLMTGTSDREFSPNLTTTRGMIVTILARMEGVDTTKGAAWYAAGREWAMKNGISDGTNMEANITREQLATILFRYVVYKGLDLVTLEDNLSRFSDRNEISSYAVSAMNWAVGQGLVKGSGGKLNPKGNATRAQVAAILHRFCELGK